MSAPERPDRLAGFDGLRAVAALAIVGLHVTSDTGAVTATRLGHYFARLDVGVTMFFVISAFLLYRPFVAAHLGARGPVSLRAYGWRRVLRIYPAYWVALTATILCFRTTALSGFWDYARHYLLVQIYQPKYGLAGIVPSWTLAVELSFYAALPLYAWLLATLTRGRSPGRRVAIEIAGAAALYAFGLAWHLGVVTTSGGGTNAPGARWLPAMADWFALGLLLAVVRSAGELSSVCASARRLADRYADVAVVLAGIAFVAVCNIGLPVNGTSGTVAEDMAREVLFGVVAILLVAPAALGRNHRGVTMRLLNSRVAVAVGTVSYGVFLWHDQWLAQLHTWGAFDWIAQLRLVSVLVMTLMLTLVTAAVSWVVVERPLLRRKDRVGGPDALQLGRSVIELPRSRRAAALVVAAFVAAELGFAIWAAFVAHGPVGPRVGYGPDSAIYILSARSPVWSHRFLAGPGPFGFLLLAKIVARNLRAIVIAQTLVTTAAWVFLATTVVAVVRTNVARWIALIALLGLGLIPEVLQWNAIISTESLSISTLCVVVALGLTVVVRGRRRDLIAFIAAVFAFAFTRDTNALLVGALALVALVAAVRPNWRVRGLAIGIAGLVFAFTASTLSNAADPPRWFWPIGETVSIRLLADPGATRYLVAHGFPLDAATRDLPRSYIFVVEDVVHGRAYAPLRAWLRTDGRHVYFEYLLTHPGWTIRKPFDDRQRLFGSIVEVYGVAYHIQPRGPFNTIGWVVAPHSIPFTELWLLAVAAALGWCWWQRRARRSAVVVVGLTLLLAIAGFYASWHGDALEADRHALTAAIQLRIALWIGTVLVVDALIARARSGVAVPGEADLDDEEHDRAPGDDGGRDRDAVPSAG